MLLGLVTCGTATLSFLAFNYSALQLQPMTWLFLQSLSLYTVYLSFQTLFFERFIACFKIKGNVGFFIITLDFIGYTGTVVVLIFKEFFNPSVNWLDFYNLMSAYFAISGRSSNATRLPDKPPAGWGVSSSSPDMAK